MSDDAPAAPHPWRLVAGLALFNVVAVCVYLAMGSDPPTEPVPIKGGPTEESPSSGSGSADPPPAPPTATVRDGAVALSWSAAAAVVEKRAIGGKAWASLPAAGEGRAIDADVREGRLYEYRVRKGTLHSAVAQVGLPPLPPTKLTAAARFTNRVSLRWTDGSRARPGFAIERQQAELWREVGRVDPGVTEFVDRPVAPSTAYRYRVRAVTRLARSQPSAEAQARTLDRYLAVAAGKSHSLAVRHDGSVWAWGQGARGQLGLGQRTSAARPTKVDGLAGMVAVACGTEHSLALDEGGRVWAWGNNTHSQLGHARGKAPEPQPRRVHGLPAIRAIAAGRDISVGLDGDGGVFLWGSFERTPKIVGTEVVEIAVGEAHVLMRRRDGSVWGLGWGGAGQLGDSRRESGVKVAVKMKLEKRAVSIGAGFDHSVVVLEDGTAWGCGNLLYLAGERTSSMQYRVLPYQFQGLKGIRRVAVGSRHVLGVDDEGLVGWGDGKFGQAGAQLQERSGPNRLPFEVEAVACGAVHSLILRGDGALFSMGRNGHRLGHGTARDASGWRKVAMPDGVRIKAICAARELCYALDDGGGVWAWGNNEYGGLLGARNTPAFVAKPTKLARLKGIVSLSTDGFKNLALDGDGRLFLWGPGVGRMGSAKIPAARVCRGLSGVVMKNGTLYVLGHNRQLKLVKGLTGVVDAVGSPTGAGQLALTKDGTVLHYGNANRPEPKAVTVLKRIVQLALGRMRVLALDEGGAVWQGRPGYHIASSRAKDWMRIAIPPAARVAAGPDHYFAIDRDGKLWAWGNNAKGQLGTGDRRTVGVARASLEGVVDIAAANGFSLAVKRDGSVWATGSSKAGTLGSGGQLAIARPTLVARIE